jgi:hypothetical protein
MNAVPQDLGVQRIQKPVREASKTLTDKPSHLEDVSVDTIILK